MLYLEMFRAIRIESTLIEGEVLPPPYSVSMDRSIIGDDDGHSHHLGDFSPRFLCGGPFAVLLVFLPGGFVHLLSRCDLHVDDNLSPFIFRDTTEPHEVRLQLGTGHTAFLHQFLGPPLFGSDGYLVLLTSYHLHVFQLLLVGD